MYRTVFLLAAASMVLASCKYVSGKHIRGNGNVITQTRNLSGFTGVDVSNAIDVYLKQDSAYSVKVVTDENLQTYILTEKQGETLRIREEENTNPDATGKIKVYVSAPLFKNLEASGASGFKSESLLQSAESVHVDVSGASEADLELKSPTVTAGMSGASKLLLRGQTRDLQVKGQGASRARCYELLSENAEVDISGASNADVFASVSLKAEASGASDIRYKGNPTVTSNSSGAGSIKKVE